MKFPSRYGKKLRVLAIYDVTRDLEVGIKKEQLADDDTVQHAKVVIKVLQISGHDVFEMIVEQTFADDILKWKDRVDVVFNLAEGVTGDLHSPAYVPFVLESLGIPFTGCGWEANLLTLDKAKTKDFLSLYNVLTPPYLFFEKIPEKIPDGLIYPLLVKPSLVDCSCGIDKNAIVHSSDELLERIKYVRDVYKMPSLVETFIDGMDVSVGVIGNPPDGVDVMNPFAIIYKNIPDDEYPIRTFDSKFDPESHSYKNATVVYPPPITQNAAEKMKEVTEKVYMLTKCSGYARLDFRVDKNMNSYFLEINANCAINEDSGFVLTAADFGLDYSQFIDRILYDGYERSLDRVDIYKK